MNIRILHAVVTTLSLTALIAASTAIAQQQTPAPPAGNATNGRTLLLKIGCYQCHGIEGQGGAAGPRIGRSPMLAFRNFVTYVRAPRGEMPPYTEKVVAEKDLSDIYAYLSTLPAAPPVESIPLLKPDTESKSGRD
jgi:ubiquinol-cytochrome c reductase cytochrome c subunit